MSHFVYVPEVEEKTVFPAPDKVLMTRQDLPFKGEGAERGCEYTLIVPLPPYFPVPSVGKAAQPSA